MIEFKKNISWVIGLLLIVLTFFANSKWQLWLLAAIFLFWGIYIVIKTWGPKWAAWKLKCEHSIMAQRIKKNHVPSKKAIQFKPLGNKGDMEHLLLGHIGCRITEKLRSVYPDVTWQWCDQPEEIILNGICRIKTFNTDDFSHAEVTIGKYHKISFKMMNIVELKSGEQTEVDSIINNSAEPKVVDVSVWYDLIGHDILTSLFDELSMHGHSSLIVHEDGSVVYTTGDNEIVAAELKELPPKQYWPELANCLKADDLDARIHNDRIKVSLI